MNLNPITYAVKSDDSSRKTKKKFLPRRLFKKSKELPMLGWFKNF
jgi:hypothetical protein